MSDRGVLFRGRCRYLVRGFGGGVEGASWQPVKGLLFFCGWVEGAFRGSPTSTPWVHVVAYNNAQPYCNQREAIRGGQENKRVNVPCFQRTGDHGWFGRQALSFTHTCNDVPQKQ